MGYWPAKLAGILNVILQVGWGTIGCIIAGQMFSAVNSNGMTIAVGCIVSALLIGIVATFGMTIVQLWERLVSVYFIVRRDRFRKLTLHKICVSSSDDCLIHAHRLSRQVF